MPWYEELFAGEDPARWNLYGETEKSRAEVDFVIEKLGLEPGARVLDLCCGQGRHLIDLVRRGYDVVGVDLSEFMLGKCREAAAAEGIEPCLLRCDMREIDFDSEFDAAINMFTAFGYLESDAEDQKVLDGIGKALKPGGRFLTSLQNRDNLMKRFQPRDWIENEHGVVVLFERRFDCRTGRNLGREIAIYPDGRRTEVTIDLRSYTCGELARMLEAAGMQVETVYGGYDGSEFTLDTKAMIVVARKAG